MDKQQIKAYFSFLFKILNTISINWGNSQALNSLLLNNLEKLDDNFAKVLQIWATDELSKVEPSRAKEIALVISDFSIQIQSFPFGSRASNLEIALTGNKMALTVFTREASSQQLYIEQWAVLQTNHGLCCKLTLLMFTAIELKETERKI
ncbi:MAG: hypothetical protein RMZ43_025565 [Nostoc sp. CmiVER01]|uniref:hypothetical protein n=1 Tax=Nostoc sp. CmiVER01 TaxID=3075384 RepID=UPI002AD4ED98|nr:hypothetical protein [Nostoc sp. CmiVER01]MDZ8121805.1 hypothetical protein [Nostoc sp. CmiVER01]